VRAIANPQSKGRTGVIWRSASYRGHHQSSVPLHRRPRIALETVGAFPYRVMRRTSSAV